MAVKSRDNLFDKPLKMLDLLRNAKWENSFLSKIALFTHSLKKVIPTFKEILSVSKTKNWCLLQNIIPTFLLKTFEFISFIIKGRDNKKVVITILHGKGFSLFRHCGKNYKFFPQCPHRGDITLATINIRNSGERG